jgi:hypothetical protein
VLVCEDDGHGATSKLPGENERKFRIGGVGDQDVPRLGADLGDGRGYAVYGFHGLLHQRRVGGWPRSWGGTGGRTEDRGKV